MDFTPADLLFPNLWSLYYTLAKATIPLLQLPLPSLIRFEIILLWKVDLCLLEDTLRSLAKTSPNIKRLGIRSLSDFEPESSKIIICGWSNLWSVTCPQVPLNVDVLVHLSCMPALTQLILTLSATFLNQSIPFDSPSLQP